MPQCTVCGGDTGERSRFCSSCGRSVEAATSFATMTAAVASVSAGAFTPTADSRFLPGTIVASRYRIIALLGKGGMGEVYRADDLTLGQQVALKFLPAPLSSSSESVNRFRNEVRVARQVSHPNVCRVYDVGEIDGHLFLSMEYVDGEDLASLLRRIGRLPADKAIEIARRLCAGLAAAHEKGVLHRDLKPGNVMLDGRGHVLLTDFGLAALAGEISGNEIRSGTPAYMAPEQLAGKEVTVRSDIYSLGLVLYEIFTGKRPFEATTLEELTRLQSQATPVSLSTLVRDLDPVVERVILRCLDPDPSRRPSSALAVSAALPGGDPLAAALAAGETPSPEMVMAAGEGEGLAPVVAIPIFAAIVIGVIVSATLKTQTSGLEMIRPQYSAEVLTQKARDVIQRIGYSADAFDDAHGFTWDIDFFSFVGKNLKHAPAWPNVLSSWKLSPLRFWYRQSPYPLIGDEFHSDLLIPGIVQDQAPPPIYSGMIDVQLDARGLLTDFRAMPPQHQEPPKEKAAPFDWSPLFTAAGLDLSQFKSAEPEWSFLTASDSRDAWTGAWPGTDRTVRIEAASMRGKPVAFSIVSPWTKPDLMPPPEEGDSNAIFYLVVSIFAAIVCFGAAILARANFVKGRGNSRGAIHLAVFMFSVLMALWICQAHFVMSLGTVGMFFLELCTGVFYGVVMWTVFVAIEPFVRRHWPQTLISLTSILTGRMRDPVVGRDVLVGVALGVVLALISQWRNVATMHDAGWTPDLFDTGILLGTRSSIGLLLEAVARQTRNVLFYFFMLFLLRVLLRNQWLAAGVWVLVFSGLDVLGGSNHLAAWLVSLLLYCLEAFVVLRWGLLSMAVGYVAALLLLGNATTPHASAFYFQNTLWASFAVLGIAAWGLFVSMAGRRLWKNSLFD
ncbi:MAG: serine/threonine-protein kinase [Bryobacteraceae bacterium]